MGTLVFTLWFLVIAQTVNMSPDKAFSGSPDHKHHHGLRWQHRPLRLAAAWPTDINMASWAVLCAPSDCKEQLTYEYWRFHIPHVHQLCLCCSTEAPFSLQEAGAVLTTH